MIYPSFPNVLLPSYDRLKLEVSLLVKKYDIHKQLYFGPINKAIIMNTAPGFFSIYQQQSVDDIILTINRLTDPAETRAGKKSNLSFLYIKSILSKDKYPCLYPKLERLITSLLKRSAKLRIWRDRRISHSDLQVLTKVDGLPRIQYEQLSECISNTISIMRHIDASFDLPDGPYEDFCIHGDGDTVLQLLNDGREHKRCKRQ